MSVKVESVGSDVATATDSSFLRPFRRNSRVDWVSLPQFFALLLENANQTVSYARVTAELIERAEVVGS